MGVPLFEGMTFLEEIAAARTESELAGVDHRWPLHEATTEAFHARMAELREAESSAGPLGRSSDHMSADERLNGHTGPPDIPAATNPGVRSLANYLAEVRAFLCRYVAFPSEHEPIAIVLWIAHAHLVEAYETSPILSVTSAEMRSGKSLLLDVLELVVPQPIRMVLPSEAVLYTVVSQRPRPTVLLDEVDAIFGPRTAEKYEGIRAILNAGNRRGSPVLRVKLDGKRREVEGFDVFGPKVIAGIGDLPTTVADRAIPIRLRRRRPDERVARFRRRQASTEAAAIELPAWPVPDVAGVPVPDELPDRAADGWEPLLAIADCAGGTWSTVARLAAVALSAEEPSTITLGIRLLGDVRDAFDGVTHLTTTALLERLHDMDDAPWGDWYGKPLTSRSLAKLLAPYRVLPKQRRSGDRNLRGYFETDFEDAWARYLPVQEPATTATSATDHVDVAGVAGVADVAVPRTPTGLWDPEYATDDDAELVSA